LTTAGGQNELKGVGRDSRRCREETHTGDSTQTYGKVIHGVGVQVAKKKRLQTSRAVFNNMKEKTKRKKREFEKATGQFKPHQGPKSG